MTQRLWAAMVAVPAVVALLVYASIGTLPYATYAPGETVDVLGTDGSASDAEIIQVDGHPVYRDDGGLLMTTVRVSPPVPPGTPKGENLWSLMATWFDRDSAVYPYDDVHSEDETPESSREQGQQQMTGSQDTAIEVALSEMGVEVPQTIEVSELTAGLPAAEVMEVGDVLRSVDGTKVTSAEQLVTLIRDAPAGTPLRIGITRDGTEQAVRVTPVRADDGRALIGIQPAVADYQFPYEVKINISPAIGGPSAGLMFSLAVYDTLTPGSLTGGRTVAGTGEINPDGTVAPIGGIQQKIAGARSDGAQLFLVPPANCADALGADNGDMRLAMATTMHDARLALEEFAEDPDADLPSCTDADQVLAGAAR
ncbi:YlbL family protein [Nocardioides litoris]|uniref:YlbL family protein n=1 Tax=Nocardioides litoris TaxID=1926648 RepID=UPI001120E064|nr:PDZ domain-containing protein [Nocardioides litoris]